MTHFIRNTQVKAMTSIWMAKQKARELPLQDVVVDAPERSALSS